MSADAPGPSKHMSVEEEAREKNMSFWDVNPGMGDAEAAELACAGDGDFQLEMEMEDATTTTDGGDHTDVGGDDHTDGGGGNPTAKKLKKQRKERTPQAVGTVTDTFTKVSKSGQPQEPWGVAKGYGMQLGCILRETVSINTYDLRSAENEALRTQLLKRLHERYIFPDDGNKKVDNFAITKMNTALTSWRGRVKAKIEKGLSWEEISAKEPYIDIEEFEALKLSLASPEAEKWTEWGKQMRAMNLGNHHLGSGGYAGKKPVWDKEDAEVARLGKENPWHKITDEQVRNFVRSRYYLKPGTGEFVTDYKDVLDFEKVLVRNLITADISKSIFVDFYTWVHVYLLCPQEAELKAEAEAGPSSQEAAGPWDTTFNRAMNVYKGRDKSKPPTSAGRVTGFGTSMKFIEYYSTDTDTKRERRKPAKDKAEVLELRKKLETLEKEKVDSSMVDKLVAEKLDEKLRSLLPPGLMEGLAAWHAGGQQGPIHVPSFTGSTSSNNVSPVLLPPIVSPVLVTPPVPPRPENNDNAHERPDNDRPAAGTGALVSTLAELNAIDKVTN